ncbi:unnamed protein product [Somion occarium]|uniref:Uncharacterized protein n=1 Tax=Somion occarium TaxID=3059160 RepID=A0ABP1DES7_9APHY
MSGPVSVQTPSASYVLLCDFMFHLQNPTSRKCRGVSVDARVIANILRPRCVILDLTLNGVSSAGRHLNLLYRFQALSSAFQYYASFQHISMAVATFDWVLNPPDYRLFSATTLRPTHASMETVGNPFSTDNHFLLFPGHLIYSQHENLPGYSEEQRNFYEHPSY